ncbi:MAG: hypothetical protein JRF33_11575 [Deltaproteobacteria bacterium]|nr:hypothetical protein [Deltaproteobacteria bacterium]
MKKHDGLTAILFSLTLSISVLGGCSSSESLCGNGQVDPGEQCDGSQLGGHSCLSLGLGEGVLACNGNCQLDRGVCEGLQPTSADVLRACVFLNLCATDILAGVSITDCVESVNLHIQSFLGVGDGLSTIDQAGAPIWACQLAAENCEQWRACTQASEAEVALCEEGDATKICNEGRAIRCGEENYLWQATDCAAAGLECVGEGGLSECSPGACDDLRFESFCQGDAMIICLNGSLLAASCHPNEGMTCAYDDGAVDCVGSGGACGADHQDRCEDSVVVRCVSGRLAEFDCRDIHPQAACRLFEGRTVCWSEIVDCDPHDYQDSCSDGRITYCDMGCEAQLDCADYGGSACTVGGVFSISRCLP